MNYHSTNVESSWLLHHYTNKPTTISIKQTVSSVSSVSPSTIDFHSLSLADRISSPPLSFSTIPTPGWTATELPIPISIHVPTTVSSIISVNVPIYAYQLQKELPGGLSLTQIARLLQDLQMAVFLSHYLDMGFPLWNPYHAYLQNQCLGNLLSLAASEVSIIRRVVLLHTIYLEIDGNSHWHYTNYICLNS